MSQRIRLERSHVLPWYQRFKSSRLLCLNIKCAVMSKSVVLAITGIEVDPSLSTQDFQVRTKAKHRSIDYGNFKGVFTK